MANIYIYIYIYTYIYIYIYVYVYIYIYIHILERETDRQVDIESLARCMRVFEKDLSEGEGTIITTISFIIIIQYLSNMYVYIYIYIYYSIV